MEFPAPAVLVDERDPAFEQYADLVVGPRTEVDFARFAGPDGDEYLLARIAEAVVFGLHPRVRARVIGLDRWHERCAGLNCDRLNGVYTSHAQPVGIGDQPPSRRMFV